MIKKFNQLLKESKGFTLVELIVVIAVLGILAGIAVPRLTGVQDSAQKETLKSNANSLKRSIDMFIAETGDLPLNDSNDSLDFSDSDYNIDFSTDDYNISVDSHDDESSNYTITIDDEDYEIEITEDGVGEVTEHSD